MPVKNISAKLLLFDIDGTLLSGRGVPKKIFLEIIRQRFPQYTNGGDLRFSGLTDPVIARKILTLNGSPHTEDAQMVAGLLEAFLDRLALYVTKENPPQVLTGVRPLLHRCQKNPHCFLGLVTGNMQRGADIKLKACRLRHYFPIGAFGSDHPERNMLPPLAWQRAEAYYGITFPKENIWIIGDSIYDVRCAKANGLHSLAVASGVTAMETLAAEKPDVLLPDLGETEKLVGILGL